MEVVDAIRVMEGDEGGTEGGTGDTDPSEAGVVPPPIAEPGVKVAKTLEVMEGELAKLPQLLPTEPLDNLCRWTNSLAGSSFLRIV